MENDEQILISLLRIKSNLDINTVSDKDFLKMFKGTSIEKESLLKIAILDFRKESICGMTSKNNINRKAKLL